MAIKVNGVTVIDDNKNWLGNGVSAAPPLVSACTISGVSTANLDISCANYYKIRANTPLTINCICNISCCSTFYIDYASNDGSKISSLPACFSYAQYANTCETRNISSVYKFENLNNKWIGCIVDRNANFGNDPIPQSTLSGVTSYMCTISGQAGGGFIPDCLVKCKVATSNGLCGLCRDLNLLTFKLGGSIYTVSPSNSPRGFTISEPINCNLSSFKTICTYCTACSLIPRLLGYSLKCDFILVGTFECGSTNWPTQACVVLEAYKLSDAIQGNRTLIQSSSFAACGYNSTAAAIRGGQCAMNSTNCATPIGGVGGYIYNFNFDECAVPLVVSDVYGYSICCNSGVPINLTNANDGMKVWLGPNVSCIFCYCLRTSGYPGYNSITSLTTCQCHGPTRAFYTKDGRYAITVDTVVYTSVTNCRYEKRITIWRDTQFGCCACTNFTGLATICDVATGTCTNCASFDLIFDCCMCHVLYFGRKETICICNTQAIGYSRTTDGCCYVISLPCVCCASAASCCQPYTACASTTTTPVSAFGICLEKNCLYSTRLVQANGVVGCGASFNPTLCSWNITTTAVDTCCFCCYYDANSIDMFTNPRDSANNYINPFYVHRLSNTNLLLI